MKSLQLYRPPSRNAQEEKRKLGKSTPIGENDKKKPEKNVATVKQGFWSLNKLNGVDWRWT